MTMGLDESGAAGGAPSAVVPTPSLILDLDALDRNIARAAEWSRRTGVGLRPHAKAHKSREVARRQIKAGAIGLCVSSAHEAEALAAPGIPSILLTSPIVSPAKARQLAGIGRHGVQPSAVADSPAIASMLAAAARDVGHSLDLFIDLDIGMGRTGTALEAVAPLAEHILSLEGVRLVGVQGYSGLVQHIADYAERAGIYRAQTELLRIGRDRLRAISPTANIVTAGGTGTMDIDGSDAIATDLQIGSYVFMDRQYSAVQLQPGSEPPLFEQSLFVRSSVISRPLPSQATLDAGTKSLGLDQPGPGVWRLRNGAPAQAHRLSYSFFGDEFGRLTGPALPEIGEWVDLVPAHCDPTVNLHDRYHVVSGGAMVDIWQIQGRGSL